MTKSQRERAAELAFLAALDEVWQAEKVLVYDCHSETLEALAKAAANLAKIRKAKEAV